MGDLIINFSNWIWDTPMLVLLMGGGFILFVYSGFLPFRRLGHAIKLVQGKYDDQNMPGQISSRQALSAAIAATVGLGNISGVAIAINMGGPGAIFWMWMSAFVGMATKYFSCSLAIMFRGKDSNGEIQGGPMYVIEEGMGKKWKPLAVLFSVAGVLGLLSIFQANQLTTVIRSVLLEPNNLDYGESTKWMLGIGMMIIVAGVILGGIKRIALVASRLVPFMVGLYFVTVIIILIQYIGNVPEMLSLIITDAFTGESVLGGAVGAVIVIGARRAAFSNEAGIGTAPMVHGASKNNEPVREGMIAMLGPFIDTVVVCTLTALVILLTGVWESTENDGVRLTLSAFEMALPGFGKYLLMIAVLVFALSTMFTYSYYGHKCFNYLFGAKRADYYNYFYLVTIVAGAVVSLEVVVSFIDGMYAIMAIPTMISTIYLAPKVKAATKDYFNRMANKS
ncbi:alanine/glycine:cation symporter family protein [Belliella kenyensis]|uniref:Alanine/glycine:cation symporter family protein n=1 Tax=Belliella kenyensis TaxID=1472724 RepID=A0ABV8EMF8_9BACT|nr:alanine/glycine:cation symporter family protein [Belliella kenyensis]MCH7403050.1 alanine:cation symporter family protein [Belliella kenyensis]MDN3605087.1 alanine/glycine:cation symporter family protein [Belliella kenyensis]